MILFITRKNVHLQRIFRACRRATNAKTPRASTGNFLKFDKILFTPMKTYTFYTI